MIFFIIKFLRELYGIKLPLAFGYYSTRMMLAAMTSLMFAIFLGPRFIKKLYELKIGQSIRTEECPLLGLLHEKKKDTPTMGGALILFSMLVSMFLWMNLKHVFTLLLLMTTIVLGLLGAQDDYLKLKYKNSKGISGKKKLLVQGLVGGLVALYLLCPVLSNGIQMGEWFQPPVVKEHFHVKSTQSDRGLQDLPPPSGAIVQRAISLNDYATRVYLPFFKEHLLSLSSVLAVLFIMVVVTGSSNAVNLTDGLDGLAAGSLIIVASCFAAIAFISNNVDLATYLNILYIEGSGEIAIYLSAFIGACMGFLWYNGYPAQVFMGDTGSLPLGGVIGVSAVLLKREFLLALVGGIFVVEALSVILQVASYRFRGKKRVFLCAPLHHHFEYKGWPETKIVIRFWIVGLLLAIIGMASLKFQ